MMITFLRKTFYVRVSITMFGTRSRLPSGDGLTLAVRLRACQGRLGSGMCVGTMSKYLKNRFDTR